MDRPGVAVVKLENAIAPSPAFERRRRRYKQAAREADASKRAKDGKKPFYITLDREGIPYGSGKPAWSQEINKLASGLDPSCTDVRKQTYEDVRIFKERLSQSFDYSGELNEGYLRSLMGKAVGRRRTGLIKKIRNGECQPIHIDSAVWKRLQKLASSKQWEDKSEQGKYANSMRKTINRTGNRGMNGVRENLREELGRSPDPDEVYVEAHRPKGPVAVKSKQETNNPQWEEVTGEESTDGLNRNKSGQNSSELQFSNDEVERALHTTSAPQVGLMDVQFCWV